VNEMMKKIILVIIAMMLIVNPISALMETRVILDPIPSTVTVGDRVPITGRIEFADGSQITVGYMQMVGVEGWINGEVYTVYPNKKVLAYCNATGYFGEMETLTKIGDNTIQFKFPGREAHNLAPSESPIYVINTVPKQHIGGSPASGLIKFIAYAKGLFALSFFGILFLTIGTGSIAAMSNDPQKQADATGRLFLLAKILLTVVTLYIAMLFMAS